MKKLYLSAVILCTMLSTLSAQQTEVYFKYDEAGNQKYRGPDSAAKQASENLSKTESKTSSLAGSQMMDEKTFGNRSVFTRFR